MSRLGIRWVVLYFLSILVPAALLAFLSVRSLRDVRDSVRQELRSKAVLAQDAFDRLLNSRAQLLAAYSEDGAMDPRLYAGFAEIAQIFAVDPSGVLRHPSVRPLRLQEPRAAFAAQIAKRIRPPRLGRRRAVLPPSLEGGGQSRRRSRSPQRARPLRL